MNFHFLYPLFSQYSGQVSAPYCFMEADYASVFRNPNRTYIENLLHTLGPFDFLIYPRSTLEMWHLLT